MIIVMGNNINSKVAQWLTTKGEAIEYYPYVSYDSFSNDSTLILLDLVAGGSFQELDPEKFTY